MGSFIIEGGHRLQGEVIPQGAKNEALQILCAVLLTAEPVTIHNLPDIVDVNKLIHLLGDLGVKTQHLGPGSWRFEADDVNLDHLKSESFRVKGGGLRGSVMILGPMLGRFGVGAILVQEETKSVADAWTRTSSASKSSGRPSRTTHPRASSTLAQRAA